MCGRVGVWVWGRVFCQLPTCLLSLAAGFPLARLRSKDRKKLGLLPALAQASEPLNTLALKDGRGPEQAAHPAKPCFLN